MVHAAGAVMALEMLALVAGAALLGWAQSQPAVGRLVKWVAGFVMVVALLSFLCTTYRAVQIYKHCPLKEMHKGEMAPCPMMQEGKD